MMTEFSFLGELTLEVTQVWNKISNMLQCFFFVNANFSLFTKFSMNSCQVPLPSHTVPLFQEFGWMTRVQK